MRKRARQALVYTAGTILFLAILAIAVYAFRFAAITNWIEEDAGVLRPYQIHLVGKDASAPPVAERDKALVEGLSEERLVVELSRSDYRNNLFGNKTWTKVHLVTAKPGDNTVNIQIKLLVILVHDEGQWKVDEVRELALP